MNFAELVLGAVTLQRLGELVLARTNERALRARGAVEIGASHYPLIVALHASWLASLWVLGHDQPVNVLALMGYLIVQALRAWVMATLGRRWTTRILVLKGETLVAAGPYRFMSHPNYAVVVCEIALLPLVLNLPLIAAIFSVLNAAVLGLRICVENRALADSQSARAGGAA
jgi:methyltransferase